MGFVTFYDLGLVTHKWNKVMHFCAKEEKGSGEGRRREGERQADRDRETGRDRQTYRKSSCFFNTRRQRPTGEQTHELTKRPV